MEKTKSDLINVMGQVGGIWTDLLVSKGYLDSSAPDIETISNIYHKLGFYYDKINSNNTFNTLFELRGPGKRSQNN